MMEYEPKDIAVVSGSVSPKVASLLYKHVLPLAPKINEADLPNILELHKLLPRFAPAELAGQDVPEILGTLQWKMFQTLGLIRDLSKVSDTDRAEECFSLLEEKFGAIGVAPLVEGMRSAWPDTAAYEKAISAQLLIIEKGFNLTRSNVEHLNGSIDEQPSDTLEDADPCLVLANIDVIDADKLEWGQILQIRSDEISARRLRRLRTFVFENFKGMPRAYIEDKLGEMIDEYHDAVEKHGGSTIKAVLKAAASEKVILGATAMFAVATGGTMPWPVALGASTVLANALIEVRASRRETEFELSQSPVRFLIDVQN